MKNSKIKNKNSQVIVARARFIKGSPRKLRLIANAICRLAPHTAASHLQVMPHRAAKTLLPVLKQAIANARSNFNLSPERLKIKSIQIGEGPRFRRQDVHARGARYGSGIRHKKLSHILVELIHGS